MENKNFMRKDIQDCAKKNILKSMVISMICRGAFNHTSAWVFPRKFATYFQNTIHKSTFWGLLLELFAKLVNSWKQSPDIEDYMDLDHSLNYILYMWILFGHASIWYVDIQPTRKYWDMNLNLKNTF